VAVGTTIRRLVAPERRASLNSRRTSLVLPAPGAPRINLIGLRRRRNGENAAWLYGITAYRIILRAVVCYHFWGSFGRNWFFRNWRLGLRRLSGRGRAAVARFYKAAVGAVVLAVVAGVVTIDEFERAGIVTESAVGEGGAGGGILGWVQIRRVRHRGLAAHFVFQAGLLHAPDAHLTPAGDGHVLDEGLLEGRLGLEFFEERGEESEKAIRGLAAENDGGGEHTVSDGVAGGGEFAHRCDRAMGFTAVGAGCVLLTFGTHATKESTRKRGWRRIGGGFVDSRGNINLRDL
jgi:hypothetical protein